MAVLQLRLNGGAAVSGGIVGAIGDVVQMTAASKSGWTTARWLIVSYPVALGVPAGWTADTDQTVKPTLYFEGVADPPAFTASITGDYEFVLAVGDAEVATVSVNGGIAGGYRLTRLKVPTAHGLKHLGRREGDEFGTAKTRHLDTWNDTIDAVEAYAVATDARLDDVEADLGQTGTDIADVAAVVATHETRLDGVDTALASLVSTDNTLDSRLDAHDTTLAGLASADTALAAADTALGTRATALEAAAVIPLQRRAKCLFLGNSITSSQSLQAGQTWPARMVARLRGGSGYHVNAGVPADTIQQMATRLAADITAKLSATDPNVFVLGMAATNNLAISHESAATIYSRETSLLDTVAANPLFHRIIVIGTGPSTAITGADETSRVSLIGLETDASTGLVARYGASRLLYIDPRRIPDLTDTLNLSDGTHPTAVMDYTLGDLFAQLVNEWIGYVERGPETRTHCHLPGDFCVGEWDPVNVTLSGSDVTQLNDTSGRAKHLVWAGSFGGNGQRPLWTANGGKPFITFDSANNEALVFNGVLFPSAGPFHVFMYISPLATTTGRVWAQGNSNAQRICALSIDNASPPQAIFENANYDSGAPTSWTVGDPDAVIRAAPRITAAAYHIVQLINDGYRMRILIENSDGTESECANMIPNTASISSTNFAFGGIWLGSGNNVFTPRTFDLKYASAHLRALPYNRVRDIKAFIHSHCD